MKTKVIKDQKLAKYLFNQGCNLVNFKENRFSPKETIFVFEETEELLRVYNIYNRVKYTNYENEE